MQYKMIFGQKLFSFFHQGRNDLRIKEVRYLHRDDSGEVSGSSRLVYDEESGGMKRYVSGAAPIASLPDDMVAFLADVSRCFGHLSGDVSLEEEMWLCVDTEVVPENRPEDGSDPETEPASDGEFSVPRMGTAEGFASYQLMQ